MNDIAVIRRSLAPWRLAVVALALLITGCQTVRSFSQGCPGVYSGLRYYADHTRDLPTDGKIFFTLDLPGSLAADTLFLPITFFASSQRPAAGFGPGCRWADAFARNQMRKARPPQ